MFTGIIQAVGSVRSIRTGSAGARLALNAPGLPRPIPLGSSVAVSGVCLTVAAGDEARLEFDVVPETLARSTLGLLRVGASVNLERALRAGDPLDGHMVQGHVDGIARVDCVRSDRGGHVVAFRVDGGLMPFLIPKGSIAIDGVSLTIASVDAASFSVALIPTTLAVTTLASLQPGDAVNIETDILARTIVTTLRRYGQGSYGTDPCGTDPCGTGFQPVDHRLKTGATQPGAAISIESLRENGW